MHEEPSTPPEGGPPGRLGTEARWRQHAAFSLFFDSQTSEAGERICRTRLYHEESGDEKTVHGGALHDWGWWILERIGPLTELGGGPEARPVSVQIRSARIVAEPSITGDVDDVQVEAQLVINGLAQLQRGLRPTMVEIVFGAKP